MSFSIKKNNPTVITSLYNPTTDIYGSFSSTQTQDLSANQVLRLVYNTEDLSSSGILCPLPSPNIFVTRSGIYKILASLQCDNTVASARTINMWISVNTIAVPNSATRVTLNNVIESLMTVEWFLSLNAGQFISIDVLSTNTGPRALAVPSSGSVPSIPSIITTITKIG